MAKKRLKRTGKVIIGTSVSLILLLIAAGVCLILYQEHLKKITPVPNDGLQIEVGTAPLPSLERYFSYLGNFETEKADAQYTSRETGTVFKPKEEETLPVGTYTVSIRSEGWDEPFVTSLTVIDTTPPVLTLKEVSVKYGGNFTENDFIESCTDNAGGDCDLSFAVTNTAGKTVDMPAPTASANYTVTVTAADASGNTAEVSTSLVIGEKPVPKPSAAQKTPYSISINRAQNTVTIFKLDGNGEYVPFKAYVCSTGGSNTPLGNFKLGARYEWLLLYGGVYGQYTTRIHGSIAFHSVPYFTQNKADLEYEEYNKLGSAASAGCVRLCVQDVKWIYDNCGAGTPVTIYDGDNPGPLGKPEPVKIDVNSPNRGWDPTDPDPANPWKNS